MSSVAKGNAFEGRVFGAIEKLVSDRRLGLDPQSVRLFRKKSYYSAARKSDIIVDISIELWPPHATNYSLLWVCECKDYSGAVPVDDIEEFKAKLDQISNANRKGVFATTGALQKAAREYAKSMGIGVMRVLPDEQVQFVMHYSTGSERSAPSPAEWERAMTQPEYVSRGGRVFGEVGGKGFQSIGGMIRGMLGG